MIAIRTRIVYNAHIPLFKKWRITTIKHIETIQKPCLKNSLAHGGCGECQASCQSACKTSCTVANQSCANKENSDVLAGNEGKLNRLYNRK